VTVELRAIEDDEFDAWAAAFELPFGDRPREDSLAAWRALIELDRTVAARDDGRMVGTAAAFSDDVAVPGGTVAMAGVTAVGVHASHRRQGLLRRMMGQLLDQARERGEPLAGLWASEAPIYGRFGFGPATSTATVSLSTAHATFARPVGTSGVRYLEDAEAVAAFPAIYDRARTRTPGLTSRSASYWHEWLTRDPEASRGGAGPRFQASLEDRGYVIYRVKHDWSDGLPNNTVVVNELMAADDEAYAALWRWCLDLDLVATVSAPLRPVDEPLAFLLTDPRRLRTVELHDALWLYPLDVPAALTARRYLLDGTLTLGLPDSTYRLTAEDGSATCMRTSDEPDLELGVGELGAVYLGGTRWSRLAAARRVRAHEPRALLRADALFSAERTPWCAQVF
jgi:predicted acetyltransferase